MNDPFLAIRSALEGSAVEVDELLRDLARRPSSSVFNQPNDATLATVEFRPATQHADKYPRLEFSNGKSSLVFLPTNGGWRDETGTEPGHQQISLAAAGAC
jgi:hypothetical protein